MKIRTGLSVLIPTFFLTLFLVLEFSRARTVDLSMHFFFAYAMGMVFTLGCLVSVLDSLGFVPISADFIFQAVLLFFSTIILAFDVLFLLFGQGGGETVIDAFRVAFAAVVVVATSFTLVLNRIDGFCRLNHPDYSVCMAILAFSLVLSLFIRDFTLVGIFCTVFLPSLAYILYQVDKRWKAWRVSISLGAPAGRLGNLNT